MGWDQMSKRKNSLGQWPASFDPFKEFDDQEWEVLEDALGQEIPEEMLIRLEGELFWWLSAFRNASEFQYGAEEQKKAVQAQNHQKNCCLAFKISGRQAKWPWMTCVSGER